MVMQLIRLRVAKTMEFHSLALGIVCQLAENVKNGTTKLKFVLIRERSAATSKAFLTNVLLIVKLHNLLSNIMRNQEK